MEPNNSNNQSTNEAKPPVPNNSTPQKSGSIFAYIAIGIIILIIGASIGYIVRENQANQEAEDLTNSIYENQQQRQEDRESVTPTDPVEPVEPTEPTSN